MTGVGSKPELVIDSVHVRYGEARAVHGASIRVPAGQVIGIVGPNGAGKTTAIRILTTILEADSGYFSVDGIGSEYPEKIRSRIGEIGRAHV